MIVVFDFICKIEINDTIRTHGKDVGNLKVFRLKYES